MPNWTKNTATQADVQVFILDTLYEALPRPPFTEQEAESLAERLYNFVWQRSSAGEAFDQAA
jgi:type I restriction enzyme R subunit